jgi:uncharacterized protein YabN with tetrapyrrole methylase and pyrophosphatase domain
MKSDALRRALAAQRRAARQGFDWPPGDPALWAKLHEEIGELKAVARQRVKAREELGDLLFMVVNLSRHLKVAPGRALDQAVRKFERRYAHIMKNARTLPRKGSRGRLAAMEALWQEAKRKEKRL